jgi:sorting and assembly machinery component 37
MQTDELPALRNGDIWIGGFRNIFHYLAQCSAGEWVLDAGLPEQEGADCIAYAPSPPYCFSTFITLLITRLTLPSFTSFSSFVESHGQPLIDLSLYVSSQNYTTTTRPLYSALLPFPLPYLTPPSIRATAKLRTAHLGLSSLDIDSDDSTPPPSQSIIPESLRRPRNTVSSLLAASPEASAQIRLDALATAFLEPLEKLRAKKQLFVSESQFTSLDCLVLGYLSLMLVPDLPQPWLAQCLKKKFPSLCTWTEELRKTVFGPEVTVHDAFLTKLGDSELDLRLKRLRGRGHLPWKAPDNGGAVGIGSVFLSGVADGIPVVGQLRRNTRMRQHGGLTTEDGVESSSFQYLTLIAGLVAGLGAVAGYMFHQGLISFGAGEETKEKEMGGGLGALGEAGAALGFYASQMDEQVRRQRVMEEMNETHGAPVAEVDVDVEVERKPLRG